MWGTEAENGLPKAIDVAGARVLIRPLELAAACPACRLRAAHGSPAPATKHHSLGGMHMTLVWGTDLDPFLSLFLLSELEKS